MQIEQKIKKLFHDIGAVRAEVSVGGVATHWITEREADIARGKLEEMGFWNVEKFRDGGCFAVFGRFPLAPELTQPMETNIPAFKGVNSRRIKFRDN